MKIAKNLGKPMVFHGFSKFWEDSGARKIEKIEERILRDAVRRRKCGQQTPVEAKRAKNEPT